MSIMIMAAWRCDLCGHVWLARGPRPPELCAKCRRRRWNTGKWDGKLGRKWPELAKVERGPLRFIVVEGMGVVVAKDGPPAEAQESARGKAAGSPAAGGPPAGRLAHWPTPQAFDAVDLDVTPEDWQRRRGGGSHPQPTDLRVCAQLAGPQETVARGSAKPRVRAKPKSKAGDA